MLSMAKTLGAALPLDAQKEHEKPKGVDEIAQGIHASGDERVSYRKVWGHYAYADGPWIPCGGRGQGFLFLHWVPTSIHLRRQNRYFAVRASHLPVFILLLLPSCLG
jgi:hypothetical protein